MQLPTPILPLLVGLADLAASQATLTLDNECTYSCQRISLGGECNTVTDCNSEWSPPGGAEIGDATCDFYRNWNCEGDPWAFAVGPDVCFTNFPFISVSVRCYVS